MQRALTFPLRCAFLALPLEGEAKERFRDIQRRLLPFAKLFRFQQDDRPHLTFFFWSSLMEIEYVDVVRRVSVIAAKTSPFTVTVSGAATFAGEKLPKVLFLTIERSAALSVLKKLCPWPNTQPFLPHVTLARMSNPQGFLAHRKDILKALKDASFQISFDRLRLYAEVEGRKQMGVQDFLFTLAL